MYSDVTLLFEQLQNSARLADKTLWSKNNTVCYWPVRRSFRLTHSCLKLPNISVVWIFDTFVANFGMEHNFGKYLMESLRLSSK